MDIKFSLPIDLSRLQNERLKLVPLEECPESIWQQFFQETCIDHPETWKYFPIGPFQTLDDYKIALTKWKYTPVGPYDTVEEYKAAYTSVFGNSSASMIFAILLKAGKVQRKNRNTGEMEVFGVEDGTFAGTTGLLYAEPKHSSVELGHVIVATQFHRTFVNTHATALLLKHLLDPTEGGDLGMRRVQWQANADNKASVKAAERMGMRLEGVMRWQRVIQEDKIGATPLPGVREDQIPTVDKEGTKLGPGRHSAMLAMCWDDWIDGGRDHVLELLKL